MRSSIFGGLLALTVAFYASLTKDVAPAAAAHAKEEGKLHVRLSEKHPGTLIMSWKGPSDKSMIRKTATAYNEHRGQISSV